MLKKEVRIHHNSVIWEVVPRPLIVERIIEPYNDGGLTMKSLLLMVKRYDCMERVRIAIRVLE